MKFTDDVVWHDDGHVLHLELNKAEILVTTVHCPGGACAHDQTACVVDWFVSTYGLDCHVGICPPEPELRVAWAHTGDKRDLDASQVWVVSTTDDMWKVWSEAQLA